jgi:IclR family acetate operon transcriptional repressor
MDVQAEGEASGDPQGADDARDGDRYLVRSVARALLIVDLVAVGPPDGLSISDIARSLGVSKSTAFATARTLVGHGFLRDSEPGPRYQLGMAFMWLGDLVSQQFQLGEVCRPVLRELTEATGMTSRVALSDGGYPVFIERVDGPGAVRFHTPLGRREAPHASAAGKAILGTLDEAHVRAICDEAGLPRRTSHTITTVDSLLEDLAIVRRRGFALDDEEDAEGVFCVGAPIFDGNRRCVGALSITGIRRDMPAWRIDELGGVVRGHADRVSGLIGGRRAKGGA